MDIAEKLVTTLIAHKKTLSTAESCTGGLIAASITDIPGASAVFEQGFVTYSDHAKHHMIGVSADTLKTHGAVSAQTAKAMAEGTLGTTGTDIAIACTGIAGPTGGSPKKPVGLVYIGIAYKGGDTQLFKKNYSGDRQNIRTQTVQDALQCVLSAVTKSP